MTSTCLSRDDAAVSLSVLRQSHASLHRHLHAPQLTAATRYLDHPSSDDAGFGSRTNMTWKCEGAPRASRCQMEEDSAAKCSVLLVCTVSAGPGNDAEAISSERWILHVVSADVVEQV